MRFKYQLKQLLNAFSIKVQARDAMQIYLCLNMSILIKNLKSFEFNQALK